MANVDVHRAAEQVRALARLDGEEGDGFRGRVIGILAGMGLALALDASKTPKGAALLVVVSRRNGTVSVYELDDQVDAGLRETARTLAGTTFQSLDDLDNADRGGVAALLFASRQTGLGPDELAGWLTDLGVTDGPDEAALEALDDALGDRFRGEAQHGHAVAELTGLAAFDQVFGFVYDGD